MPTTNFILPIFCSNAHDSFQWRARPPWRMTEDQFISGFLQCKIRINVAIGIQLVGDFVQMVKQLTNKTPEKKQQGAGAAVMTGIPLIPLESPEALRGIRCSTRKKRSVGHLHQSRTSPAPQSPTRDERSSKRARHSYERQPRHKTRDDHYEYKAPSAAGSRPQPRKGRAKNGRGRKHTLNDDFQAVNVNGNRLTVCTNFVVCLV